MGCSSSSAQTVDQEKRPGTKPEESNGDTVGKYWSTMWRVNVSKSILSLQMCFFKIGNFYILSNVHSSWSKFLTLCHCLLRGVWVLGWYTVCFLTRLSCTAHYSSSWTELFMFTHFPWSGWYLFLASQVDVQWKCVDKTCELHCMTHWWKETWEGADLRWSCLVPDLITLG